MKKLVIACTLAMATLTSQAWANEKGDIIVRVGAVTVAPAGDGALNGALDVKNNTQLGLGLDYMLTDTVGVGVLAATPFKHDITLSGEKIGSTKHLPPTVTLQYHPQTGSMMRPYVGAGINYTQFFTERSSLGDLELSHSTGLAAEAGVDFEIDKHWAANAAVWYADIDTDAKLNGAKLDKVHIDPWVYMIGAAYKF